MRNATHPRQTDQVTALYVDHGDTVRMMVAAALRPHDRSPELVDDLAQEVWLAVLVYLAGGRQIRTPLGLLRTISRNKVSNHYRRACTRNEVPADFSDTLTSRRLPVEPAAEDRALSLVDALAELRDLRAANARLAARPAVAA